MSEAEEAVNSLKAMKLNKKAIEDEINAFKHVLNILSVHIVLIISRA